MGLSDEERFLKFYTGVAILRQRLEKLKALNYQNTVPMIQGWVDTLDYVTGLCVQGMDFSGAYWILGENEGSYQSLFDETHTYDLGQQDHDSALADMHGERWRLHEQLKGCVKSMVEFAQAIGHKFPHTYSDDRAIYLAQYWEAWQIGGFIFYAANRYRDKLFRACHKELLTLLGKIANQRYVGTGLYASDDWASKRLEGLVFAKYRVYYEKLEKRLHAEQGKVLARCGDKRGAAFKKAKHKLSETTAYKVLEDFRALEKGLVLEVGRMPAHQVKKFLEELHEAKWKRKQSFHEERDEEKNTPKHCGWEGEEPRSREELAAVLDADWSESTEEVYEKARQEMKDVYGSHYMPSWADSKKRDAKKKARGKKTVNLSKARPSQLRKLVENQRKTAKAKKKKASTKK